MEFPAHILFAFVLTVIAGLSTGIGSLIAYFIRTPKMIYLSFSLGFSAGVMIYVSFVELLPQTMVQLGQLTGIIVFFLGILLIACIDMIIPEARNPHHYKDMPQEQSLKVDKTLMRTGLFTAFAIAIHNFPEGLTTFGTTLSDERLGLVIALAIAIHNIPEGISVSVPIFYATGSRKKAFKYSFMAGLAEPLGAVIGFLILLPFLSSTILISLLAFIAGIMVYISIDELLPMAHRYGHSHTVILGFILGMALMAASLFLL
ncbi:MAG: zupT [Thermoplasmatales archaeon]|jgi:ZIP family zinc transporter|nr:zupT [Thermoplasmatales archaeon]